MSLHLPKRRNERPQLETALAIVNIVLLLIFFFLVVGQGQRAPSDLQLARTAEIDLGSLPSPVLEIRAANDWVLDGEPVQPDLLSAAIAGKPGPLHLMMDRQADADLLIQSLRRIEADDREVRLVTLRQAQP